MSVRDYKNNPHLRKYLCVAEFRLKIILSASRHNVSGSNAVAYINAHVTIHSFSSYRERFQSRVSRGFCLGILAEEMPDNFVKHS